MIPQWIVAVLNRELPELTGGERDRVATALADAIPGESIVTAIAGSTATVLKQRCLADDGGLSKEIARNSAATVVFALAGWSE